MQKAILLYFLFLSQLVFSQNHNCDCLVRYGFFYDAKKPVEKVMKPFVPKTGQPFAFHTVVKDSGAWWWIKPHVNDLGAKDTVIAIKKSSNIQLLSEILFNGADSIPVFEEAKKGSKVLFYLHYDKGQTGSKPEYMNYQWFMGCRNGYVKILGNVSGWVRKENYVHYLKKKS